MNQQHPLTSVPESSVDDAQGGKIMEMNRSHSHNATLSDRFTEHCQKIGTVKFFCRQKGHGFIQPDEGDKIFVHIQDVEGKWIPHVGDIVEYKESMIPPKMEQKQAVNVRLRQLHTPVDS